MKPLLISLLIILSNTQLAFSHNHLPYQLSWPKPLMILPEAHPSFDMETLLPLNFEPNIGGLKFLSDGRLALLIFLDKGIYTFQNGNGKLLILDSPLNDGKNYQIREIETGLNQPLGLELIDDTLFVIHQHEIIKFYDNNGSGNFLGREVLPSIPNEFRSGWTLGLIHNKGFLYSNTGNNFSKTFRYNLTSKTYESVSEATRHDNGLGEGPDGEMFIISQQGEWYPTGELQHIKKGRIFNNGGNRNYPASVLFPHGDAANSPSQPILFESGIFKGQMVMGDMRHGNMHRVYFEKIKDHYQGGLINFSGGTMSGINRITWGPDGALYLGGAGAKNHWTHNYEDTFFGLQRLVPNGKFSFEILSTQSKEKGFLIEFTQPLDLNTIDIDKFLVRSWHYMATVAYGTEKSDLDTLNISSITLSDDRTQVYLEISGLQLGKVIHISHDNTIRSSSGLKPWISETWYTLNNLGPVFDSSDFITSFKDLKKNLDQLITISKNLEETWIHIHSPSLHIIDVYGIRGEKLFSFIGTGFKNYSLENKLKKGTYFIHSSIGNRSITKKFIQF